MSDRRFLSPGRPLPVQMFYSDENSTASISPQIRSFSSFSPVMPPIVFQPQPIILRADSPIPFLRQESPFHRPFVLSPQVMQQQILIPQENRCSRYSSPVPGTYIVSNPGKHSLPSTSVAGLSHHRNSPMKLMCMVQSPSSQLYYRHSRESSPGAQTFGPSSQLHPNYQQASSECTPHIGNDPALAFTARMQQRQGARKIMAADWNKWDAQSKCDKKQRDAHNGIPLLRNFSSIDHRSTSAASLPIRSGVAQHTMRPSAIGSLKLTVLSARNLPLLNGACNSYCSILYGGHSEKTPVCFESINPKWNHVCIMKSNVTDGEVGISLFHCNQNGNEQLIGVVGFSTGQVLSGVCEKAFILKFLDGTAIIGNDGCPAYLDIAVVADDEENPAEAFTGTLHQQKNHAHKRWSTGRDWSSNLQECSNGRAKCQADHFQYQRQSMLAKQADIGKHSRASIVGNVHPVISKNSNQLKDYPEREGKTFSFGSLRDFQDHGCTNLLPDPETVKHTSRLSISGVPALDVHQNQDMGCSRSDPLPARYGPSFGDAQRTTAHFSAHSSDILHHSANFNLQRSSLGSTNCGHSVESTEASSKLSTFAMMHPRSQVRAELEEVAESSLNDTLLIVDLPSSSSSKASSALPPLHVNYNQYHYIQDCVHVAYGENSADQGRLSSMYASLQTQDNQDDASWIVPSLYASRVGAVEVSKPLNHEDSARNHIPAMIPSANTQHFAVTDRSESVSYSQCFGSITSTCGSRERKQLKQGSGGHKDSYSVGIRVSKGPPYYVVEIQSLMDENCVLQGMQGFKYGFISVGDRLVMLDGIPVNDLSSDELEEHFNGHMLSVCEITLEISKILAQRKILAMRHVLSQNQAA